MLGIVMPKVGSRDGNMIKRYWVQLARRPKVYIPNWLWDLNDLGCHLINGTDNTANESIYRRPFSNYNHWADHENIQMYNVGDILLVSPSNEQRQNRRDGSECWPKIIKAGSRNIQGISSRAHLEVEVLWFVLGQLFRLFPYFPSAAHQKRYVVSSTENRSIARLGRVVGFLLECRSFLRGFDLRARRWYDWSGRIGSGWGAGFQFLWLYAW